MESLKDAKQIFIDNSYKDINGNRHLNSGLNYLELLKEAGYKKVACLSEISNEAKIINLEELLND